jgi:hypothetical protein
MTLFVRIILFLLTSIGYGSSLEAQISDPIPEAIEPGEIVMPLEDWLQAPATGPEPTLARLSVMKPAYDGSGRIFLADLRGQMYAIDGDDMTDYANLTDVFPDFVDAPERGSGFHAFAFHPDFSSNGKFYTVHTEPGSSGVADFGPLLELESTLQSVVTEWTANDSSLQVFSGTQREVLRIEYPIAFHNIQEVAFNHHVGRGHEDYGMLYVCVGDGAAVNLNPVLGHRLDSVYSTLLRIDPLGSDSENGQYGVPDSNPFVNDNSGDTLGEIYAWGFRNPHRICWDPANPDRMFLADIGQSQIEEINLVIKGGDYGWSEREGTFLLDAESDDTVVYPLPPNDTDFDYLYPVAQYDHDDGMAITGGFVYRGLQQLIGLLKLVHLDG